MFILFQISLQQYSLIKDFATRSLNISEESPGMVGRGAANNDDDDDGDNVLDLYQMRRTWESR